MNVNSKCAHSSENCGEHEIEETKHNVLCPRELKLTRTQYSKWQRESGQRKLFHLMKSTPSPAICTAHETASLIIYPVTQ